MTTKTKAKSSKSKKPGKAKAPTPATASKRGPGGKFVKRVPDAPMRVAPPLATGDCPRGGKHEWDPGLDASDCVKCHEPLPKDLRIKGLKADEKVELAQDEPAQNETIPPSETIEAQSEAIAPADETPPTPQETPTIAQDVAVANPGKMSQLDAAALAMGHLGRPANTKELVQVMADRDLWHSPGGKTPHATLASGLMREISKKGDASRFAKADRGKFELRSLAARLGVVESPADAVEGGAA